jgi:hypothetical protein
MMRFKITTGLWCKVVCFFGASMLLKEIVEINTSLEAKDSHERKAKHMR